MGRPSVPEEFRGNINDRFESLEQKIDSSGDRLWGRWWGIMAVVLVIAAGAMGFLYSELRRLDDKVAEIQKNVAVLDSRLPKQSR